jgi:transposase
MARAIAESPPLSSFLTALSRGELTDAQARVVAARGPEAVLLMLITANARIVELQSRAVAAASPSPSTPSAMIPVYEKPVVKKRGKKPGAKVGHEGSRRKTPVNIDAKVDHRLEVCPCCGGELQKCDRTRTRIIEDIPENITPVVTEHTIHRDYCAHCKKHVEPVVSDAMPNAVLGHNVIALSSWFHYGLGVTIGQVRDILTSHLHTEISAGGLLSGWNRLAEALWPWYEQIGNEARAGAVLHADETGWRVDGDTQWLWCFCNPDTCYYMIDESRGLPALKKFFTEAFKGVLVTDFWAAYDSVSAGDYQKCLPHLLREVIKVDEYNQNIEWKNFSKQLKRLIHDGIRLRKRPDYTREKYASRVLLIDKRLNALGDTSYDDPDTNRLGKRISKYRDQLFTFLDFPEVPSNNNHDERQIRVGVIMRKNILCNRSDNGAKTQGALMSIYRTLKMRGHDPTATIAAALRELLKTGKLPPLPGKVVAEG